MQSSPPIFRVIYNIDQLKGLYCAPNGGQVTFFKKLSNSYCFQAKKSNFEIC